MSRLRLDTFRNEDFDRGRSRLIELLWVACSGCLFSTWLPGSGWRAGLLRMFGARVGRGAVIKPRVRVKFPWRLQMGDQVWIGESVWIDNLADVTLGSNVCISQGAYFCCGNHDYKDPAFALRTAPITVGDGAWIGAMSRIAPGVSIGAGSVIAIGSVVARAIAQDSVLRVDGSVTMRDGALSP